MLEQILQNNEFFQGGFVLMLIGGAVAALRYAPVLIWHYIQRWWTVSVTVRDQTLVRWLGLWLSTIDYGKRCRWLDGVGKEGNKGAESVLRPGYGLHTFKFEGKRFWLEHSLEDNAMAGKIDIIELKTLGRDMNAIKKAMSAATKAANIERGDRNTIYVNRDDWWQRIQLVDRRSRDSVFLSDGRVEEILSDARSFMEDDIWYKARGLPHRRGYLLYGPPGNGKSTIAQVLSSELVTPIYALSLLEPDLSDSLLARLVGRVPHGCILLLEDFDKLDFNSKKMGVTVSGLLNAMDGPLASVGRLMIITANDVSAIHEAFLRPGRIDRSWNIGFPDASAIRQCVRRFSVNGDRPNEAFVRHAVKNGWSMARVQQELRRAICYS